MAICVFVVKRRGNTHTVARRWIKYTKSLSPVLIHMKVALIQIRCAISSHNCFFFPVPSAIIFVPEHIRVYIVLRSQTVKRGRQKKKKNVSNTCFRTIRNNRTDVPGTGRLKAVSKVYILYK
jgi:hypothetical protein